MHKRNPYRNQHQEPQVIALAATREKPFHPFLWQIGMALLAYSWLSVVLK